MSFLPKLSPEEFEELFLLFTRAIYQVGGISPKEVRELQSNRENGYKRFGMQPSPNPFRWCSRISGKALSNNF
jgi:hypothetical protein